VRVLPLSDPPREEQPQKDTKKGPLFCYPSISASSKESVIKQTRPRKSILDGSAVQGAIYSPRRLKEKMTSQGIPPLDVARG